jgi:hypothetical protein
MSSNDKEMEIDDLEDVEIGSGDAEDVTLTSPLDEGFELSFDEDESLDLGEPGLAAQDKTSEDVFGDLSLDEGEEFSLASEGEESELTGARSLSLDDSELDMDDEVLDLSDEPPSTDLTFDDEMSLDALDDNDTNIVEEEIEPVTSQTELSQDARAKLKEIDEIMDLDASQVDLSIDQLEASDNLDEPLVSDDLDLGSLDFSADDALQEEEEEVTRIHVREEKPKKKKKEVFETAKERDFGQDLKEISGAYSGEMERMQATISNLRSDREELLKKIQKHEDEKLMENRQSLSLRAELDEKKIELTIIRKKLNEEINELKDRLKFFDEKRLILEEKNRILTQELDKASQKNKIDVKKVQLRERELEQKLELLKSDAETQIRHRDLKILELKRKIDAMEFDMESISNQEKRSVESRFELEDKLEKAIKTLRGAITVLEDESDRTSALDALKKNIDM